MMDKKAYISSGILELYVFGQLSESESNEVAKMAKNDEEIKTEIISIENAVINFTESVSPFLSSGNYEKIRKSLLLGLEETSVKPKSKIVLYASCAVAFLLLFAIGSQYVRLKDKNAKIANIETEKSKLQESIAGLTLENKSNQEALSIVRDIKNDVIPLPGQEVSPQSYAIVYWNRETQVVHIDAAGLPELPEGMVYQVWALKLNPLTPKNIGFLENFKANSQRIFNVRSTGETEAFGITLEPAGGSQRPTLEKLYVMGKA